MLLSLIPILYLKKLHEQHCHAFSLSSLFKGSLNNIKGRTNSLQYAANNPIEDRVIEENFQELDGFVTAVLDGHGGYNVAEFISKNLTAELEESIKKELNISKDDYYKKPFKTHTYLKGKEG